MTTTYPNDTHLAPNLRWDEMRCNCGAPMDATQKKNAIVYAKVWQKVRTAYGAPMHINCGHRCERCNTRVGGAPKSLHLLARATDNSSVDVTTVGAIAIAKVAITIPEVRGLCVYDDQHGRFVHIDDRPGPRWYAVNGGKVAADGEARLRRWIAAGRVVP